MSLAGRVALVTGASRGIGRASAVALAEEGARLAIGYRQDKDGAMEAAEICKDAIVVHIDITEPESIAACFDEVEHQLGGVEILVNNAGITKDRLLIRMSEEDWAQVLATNLTGAFRVTKRAIPTMLKARWGRVISIGSVVGSQGNPAQTNYAASKAGLIGFTKALAREVANHGITANVVAPGYVETELTGAELSESQRSDLVDRIPLKRPASAEEVAEAVTFCARASYLTGQVVAIDGGLS